MIFTSTIKPNIKSAFFTETHINDYISKLSEKYTATHTILNLEKLVDHIFTIHRYLSKNKESFKASIEKVKAQLIQKICGTENEKHIVAQMFDTKSPQKYDMLLILKKYKPSGETRTDQFLNNIRGIVVVENNAIILLCTPGKRQPHARILVGAYLYKLAEASRGIAYITNGYENLADLCVFSEFGFTPNLEYLNADCFFEGKLRLPLATPSSMSTTEIMNIVSKRTKSQLSIDAMKDATDRDILNHHPLCNKTLFENDTKRQELAKLHNNLVKLRIFKDKIPEDYLRKVEQDLADLEKLANLKTQQEKLEADLKTQQKELETGAKRKATDEAQLELIQKLKSNMEDITRRREQIQSEIDVVMANTKHMDATSDNVDKKLVEVQTKINSIKQIIAEIDKLESEIDETKTLDEKITEISDSIRETKRMIFDRYIKIPITEWSIIEDDEDEYEDEDEYTPDFETEGGRKKRRAAATKKRRVRRKQTRRVRRLRRQR